MYNNQRIVMVVPCYNEEIGIEQILRQLPPYIDEVVVVDNDSIDNTAQVAKKYGAKVILEKRRGYGSAYQAGLSSLNNGDIVVMLDGDNTIPLGEIEQFLRRIGQEGYDFLSGCRFPLTDPRAMPFVKLISNHFFSWVIRKFFGVHLMDSQSGLFVFRRPLLPGILSLNTGMGFSMEFKLNAWLNPSVKCGELHINYCVRSGKVKYRALQDSTMIIKDFWAYFINYKNKKTQI